MSKSRIERMRGAAYKRRKKKGLISRQEGWSW